MGNDFAYRQFIFVGKIKTIQLWEHVETKMVT
jgi:hypothetical protein